MGVALEIVGVVGFVTALLDVMGNGAGHASWAPYGICAAISCLSVMQWGFL